MSNPAASNAAADASGARNPWRLLAIALAMVLLGSIGAWLVKTGAGTIDVLRIKLPTENGQWVVADLFRPATATEKTPAPAVVVCPGFERSKETLDSYSIELARRGFVVITIDPYNQGASSSTMQRRSASVEGYGVVPMIEYIHGTPNLNFIDKTRIGATGYSAGGNAVLQVASLLGARQQGRAPRRAGARAAATASAERPAAGGPVKLSAIFIGGYILTMTDAVLATVDVNIGTDYARYDEGAFRSEGRSADLRTSPEALRLVNSGLKPGEKITAVEIGKVYGDKAQRTMRVVYNTPRNIHPLLPYDRESIGRMVGFFVDVLDLKSDIPPSNQTWWIKELCTLVSFVGALLFPFPLAALLLRLPFFCSLVHPLPSPLPAPSRAGKILFWVTFAFSAALACYLFVPMARLAEHLFPTASGAQQTWFFPQRMNNTVLLWAVANGAIGLLVFFLTYHLWSKRRGVTAEMLGLRVTGGELARTFLLALLVLGGFYALLFSCYAVFHVDFRFLFVAAAADFPVKMLVVALEYLPLFFVFYLANSIRVNSASRFAGQKEWVGMLIMGLGNSVGLFLIVAIHYGWFIATGTVFWTKGTDWLHVNLLFGIIPMMFLLPYFNRAFFRLTGRVYLGPMVTCLIFILMMLTSTVCYIPLR